MVQLVREPGSAASLI